MGEFGDEMMLNLVDLVYFVFDIMEVYDFLWVSVDSFGEFVFYVRIYLIVIWICFCCRIIFEDGFERGEE